MVLHVNKAINRWKVRNFNQIRSFTNPVPFLWGQVMWIAGWHTTVPKLPPQVLSEKYFQFYAPIQLYPVVNRPSIYLVYYFIAELVNRKIGKVSSIQIRE